MNIVNLLFLLDNLRSVTILSRDFVLFDVCPSRDDPLELDESDEPLSSLESDDP